MGDLNAYTYNNKHLRLRFEGKIEESDALYKANKKGLIEFKTFWIYASLLKVKQSFRRRDFYFQATLHSFGNKDDTYNQNFNFCYKKGMFDEVNIENLVEQLAQIGFALKIHKLEKPYIFATYTKNEPIKIDGMYAALADLQTDENLYRNL